MDRRPLARIWRTIETYEIIVTYLEVVDYALKGEVTRLILRGIRKLESISQPPPEPPPEPIKVESLRLE